METITISKEHYNLKDIINGCQLIANYMNNPISYDGVGNVLKTSSWIDSKFKVPKYDMSWDSLIPVIDKLSNDGTYVHINTKSILATFNEVVEYIKNNCD